jgi:hypothetical protein
MDDGRWQALMSDVKLTLTAEELAEGWHWCPNWDDLLVGPGMELELSCCRCKEA